MRTQIQIHNSFIELLSEPNLNITKSIVDIKDPEGRTTDRTLTIDIPGSKTNNALFSHIFDVNLEITNVSGNFNPDFDPNKRASIWIWVDTMQQFAGYCQLTDIVITNENKIVYKIVGYGQTADLISSIGQALLTDLDLSEFDHDYTYANITNSWGTSIIQNGSPVAFALGTGYYYPMIDYGAKSTQADYETWYVENFKPGVYAKQILDKIFEAAGFTYSSAFFDSTRFKSLIIPFSNEKLVLSESSITEKLLYVGRTSTDQTINGASSGTKIILNDDSTPPFYDNGGDYDTSTGIWLVPAKGVYQLNAKIKIQAELQQEFVDGYEYFVYVTCRMIRNPGSAQTVQTAGAKLTFATGPKPIGSLSDTQEVNFSFSGLLLENDQVYIELGQVTFQANYVSGTPSGAVLSPSFIDLNIKTTSYMYNGVVNEGIFEGMEVDMNAVLPKDYLQRDFVTSLVRMFNLYVQPDAEDETLLIIEPRGDYYTDDVVDWTHKIDLSRESTIKPMAFLDAKRYTFTYEADKDYYNQAYLNEFGYLYGRRYINIDNDFIKDNKEITVKFAPTPLASVPFNDRILSSIIFTDQNGQVNYFSASFPRILYIDIDRATAQEWTFSYNNGNNSTFFSTYPYAGHLDDPTSAEFDLNFAIPQKIYFNGSNNLPVLPSFTNQNLYNLYWREDILQRADKNSKYLEAYFFLDPVDILSLSFRKLYFIRSQYYRLIEVSNYDPVNESVTLCKLAKYIDVEPVSPNSTTINGGAGTFDGTQLPLNNDTFILGPGGNRTSPGSIGKGKGSSNFGDAGNVITGDDNNIGIQAKKVSVLNSQRVSVPGGFENVTVINTQDYEVLRSDVTIIAGAEFTPQGGYKFVDTDNYMPTIEDYLIEVDASAGPLTMILPENIVMQKEYCFIKIDTTENAVTIGTEYGSPVTILTMTNESITVIRGSAWRFKA